MGDAIEPNSIPGLVRSSNRPRVPLTAAAVVLAVAAAVLLTLAALFFGPPPVQGQDNGGAEQQGDAGAAVERLSFGNSTIADQSYTKDTAITTLTLPAATASNGEPAITYSLSPSLPSGLSFDPAARTVTGTPSAAAASATYTYAAAADGYSPARLSFGFAVVLPAPATPSAVSVTRSDGALNASWPAVEHATGYHVTYSSDGGASWSLAALNHPDASITISGVDNAKTYVVGVRARNDSGDSGWRNSPATGPLHAAQTRTHTYTHAYAYAGTYTYADAGANPGTHTHADPGGGRPFHRHRHPQRRRNLGVGFLDGLRRQRL